VEVAARPIIPCCISRAIALFICLIAAATPSAATAVIACCCCCCCCCLPQVSIDGDTFKALEAAARAEGKSIAHIASEKLQQASGATQ